MRQAKKSLDYRRYTVGRRPDRMNVMRNTPAPGLLSRLWLRLNEFALEPLLLYIFAVALVGSFLLLRYIFRLPSRREAFAGFVLWLAGRHQWLVRKFFGTAATTARFIRPRLRFSLRTVIVTMISICALLAWVGSLMRRVQQQRAVVQRIEQLGGQTSFDYQHRFEGTAIKTPPPPGNWLLRKVVGDDVYAHVDSIYFYNQISDADLLVLSEAPDVTFVGITGGSLTNKAITNLELAKKLNRLSLRQCDITAADLSASLIALRLQTLALSGPSVTDATLAEVPKLTKLTTLELFDANITDAGLEFVATCNQLKTLSVLRCTAITDQGLDRLDRLKHLTNLRLAELPAAAGGMQCLDGLPRLEELQLWGIPLPAAAMQHFRGLKSMRNLILSGCQVDDAGAANLAEMRQLEQLNLNGATITDASIRMLTRFTRLKQLSLWTRQTTDAAVGEFSTLTHLERLTVGPGITRDGAVALSRALRKCHVEYIDPNGGAWQLPLGGY